MAILGIGRSRLHRLPYSVRTALMQDGRWWWPTTCRPVFGRPSTPRQNFISWTSGTRARWTPCFRPEKIDGVIHFAASSQVGESMSDPLKYYDNNLYGTMVLLRSMVEHGVDKIVFSSTAATYGEPERVPILESDTHQPHQLLRRRPSCSMEQMMELGLPGARPALCGPALFQRLRRAPLRHRSARRTTPRPT